MYRKIEDFVADYTEESREAQKNWDALSDASLTTSPAEGFWTIGDHLWHVAAIWDLLFITDLKLWPPENEPPREAPASAKELASYYQDATNRVCEWVGSNWSDADLKNELELWGMKMTFGKLLWEMVKHEAHHRGQIVVLMRIAKIPVHGIYGPSMEEAKAMQTPSASEDST